MKTVRLVSVLVLVVTMIVQPMPARAESGSYLRTLWDYPSRTFGAVDALVYGIFGRPVQVENENQGGKWEDLVNQPPIELVVPEPVDLMSKTDSTGEVLDRIYLGYQLVLGEAVLVGFNWDTLTVADVAQSTEKLIGILEGIKQLDWLTAAWGWEELDTIGVLENQIKSDLVTVRSIVTTSGMLPVAYSELKSAVENLGVIQKLIGEKTDLDSDQTLYGEYQRVRRKAGEWESLRRQPEEAKILALNRIPGVDRILAAGGKNRVLGLMGLVQANKSLLAANRGAAITTTWLEEDPLVVKTLVSNSSPLARQEVAVKYYLPAEVQEQDILYRDLNLAIKFDSDRHRFFAEGDLTIAAGDTRVVTTKIFDRWQFDRGQRDKVWLQATELVESLKRGGAVVDGVALKSDIRVALEMIGDWQSRAVTPEARITAWRWANLEMVTVEEKLEQIRRLVIRTNSVQRSLSLNELSKVVAVVGGLGLGVWGMVYLVRRSRLSQPRFGQSVPSVKHFNVFSNRIASSDL